MKMPVQDVESGEIISTLEIPDDVVEAAAKVEAWLKSMPATMQLHGVRLATEHDY